MAERIDGLLASAYHDPSLITDEIRAGYRLPLRAKDWDRGLAWFVSAPTLVSPRARLGELGVPVLVVTGDDDKWVKTTATISLAADIPTASLAVVPDCGHLVHAECPAAFVEAVKEWIAAALR